MSVGAICLTSSSSNGGRWMVLVPRPPPPLFFSFFEKRLFFPICNLRQKKVYATYTKKNKVDEQNTTYAKKNTRLATKRQQVILIFTIELQSPPTQASEVPENWGTCQSIFLTNVPPYWKQEIIRTLLWTQGTG